jgi:hypothetical protein
MTKALTIILALLTITSARAASLFPAYSNSAGAVSQISATVGKYGVYTAVINSSGNLEIIAWNDTGTALLRTKSITLGAARAVAAGWWGAPADYLITVLANGSGNLELISWQMIRTVR